MIGKGYLVISGIVFCLVAILHLFRVLFHVPIQIGAWAAPFWMSWGGFIGAGILCIWAFRLRSK
jgi:hypothetical protein